MAKDARPRPVDAARRLVNIGASATSLAAANGQPQIGSNASITMVLWRKKAPPKPKEEVPAPAAPIELVAAAPAEEERLPPPAAFRASQEIANRNFCDDDDDEDQSVG